MPPRLPVLRTFCRPVAAASSPATAFLLPSFQARGASILSGLSDNKGAYNKRIRVGRGPSSGKGKTSGRGHKGQRAHGKVPALFQGGQTPQWEVHGIRGTKNLFSEEFSPVNLDRIQSWIDQGRLDPTKTITLKELVNTRCIHGIKDGVKLLARGKEQLKTPIDILVSRASATAIEAIEAAGGKVTTRYYTKHSIKRLLKGKSESSHIPLALTPVPTAGSPIPTAAATAFQFSYRLPDPTSRRDLEYYRDSAHRGYLSHLVEEGQGPSLFFKTPRTGTARKAKKTGTGAVSSAENKIW